MPRPRLPHLHRETSRHGRTVWYVRVGKGPRIRLKAEFGSPEFEAEYQAAIAGKPRPGRGEAPSGTLAWLIARYRETSAWLKSPLRQPVVGNASPPQPKSGLTDLRKISRSPGKPGERVGGGEQTAVAARAGSISTVSVLVSLDHPYRK